MGRPTGPVCKGIGKIAVCVPARAFLLSPFASKYFCCHACPALRVWLRKGSKKCTLVDVFCQYLSIASNFMSLLPPHESAPCWRLRGSVTSTPSCPDRIALERQALGTIQGGRADHSTSPGESIEDIFGNIPAMRGRTGSSCPRFVDGSRKATRQHATNFVYEDLALYLIYSRYMSASMGLSRGPWNSPPGTEKVHCWADFQAEFRQLFHIPGHELPSDHGPKVIFAGFFQIERAFTHIYQSASSVDRCRRLGCGRRSGSRSSPTT